MIGSQLGLGISTSLGELAANHPFALNALLLLDDEKVPNEEALAIAPLVGWLFLVGTIAVVVLFILNSEWWRRWWLVVEDPRAVALWRIVFGFFVICNMNDFYEYWTFLFTDEGIFTADVARQVHASGQFQGFGDGLTEDDPWGFFDFWAVIEFLKGPKYSLLYIWDSPTAFWIHMGAFQLCAVLFMIGFRTRLMGVLTFFLMNSIFFRNHLFWEGTELVYRVYLAYLICAKSGHAYSVDNWLRCRKLRKQGLLSERGGPGNGAGVAPSEEHPNGLQAIYRLIPAWPRRLAIVQLAATYIVTGILKNGSVWAKGDAVYYAWNMDHFYRFYPQRITAIIGTNFMRIVTWYSHWGEALFFLVVFGVLTHWAATEKVPRSSPAKRIVVNLCWAAIIAISAAVIWVTWSVHFTPQIPREVFVGGWVWLLVAIWGLWVRIDREPLKLTGREGMWILWLVLVAVVDLLLWLLLFPLLNAKEAMTPIWVSRKLGIMAAWTAVAVLVPLLTLKFMPAVARFVRGLPLLRLVLTDAFIDGKHVIDRKWIASWVLGRRIWVIWHISLQGGIFFLMNIGQFQTGMLSQSLVYLYGAEAAVIVLWLARRVRLTTETEPIPAEDPTLPHHKRDAAKMPQWAMLIGAGVFLIGALVRIRVEPEWEWRWVWVAGFAFLAGVACWNWVSTKGKRLPTPEKEEPLRAVWPDGKNLRLDEPSPRMPWAYGPFGRFIISSLLIWHIVGVTIWLLPDKNCLDPWRNPARQVWTKWLTTTQTDQGWGMFAPNPPRTNVFLKVLVTDESGEVFDLKTDVYAEERRPIPWIWNDRMRKMNRRIIGGESGNTQWYRKWYARYICRQWALEHEGQGPRKVELVKVWYRMPSPEETWKHGYYDTWDLLARTGAEKIEHTEHCKRTVQGQLPNWIRERHGLDPLPDDWEYKPWIKHKKNKWDREMAKRRGEEEPADANKTTARADVKQ